MLKPADRALYALAYFVLAVAAAPADDAHWTLSVERTATITQQTDRYHGWPTLTRLASGELMVVCSGGREAHVCPFGRVELLRSADEGQTWSFNRTILDGPIDDRDAGIVRTLSGTLLVTTFTSLAYWPILKRANERAGTDAPAMDAERLSRWNAAHARVAAGAHQDHLGCRCVRSTDNGRTWSAPIDTLVNSPHGPITLASGRLFYAGVRLWDEGRRVGVAVSDDDGQTWQWLSDIPTRAGDESKNYHELHAVEAAGGRLVVHIRNHNAVNNREILQTHSDDGGESWVEPYTIGVWGLPSHLLKTSDGRLLMSYGHRRAPLGNQVRVSDDDGSTWSDPLIITGNATSGDLGYPSTVELEPGRFVTVWYERMKENPNGVLRMATWRLTTDSVQP